MVIYFIACYLLTPRPLLHLTSDRLSLSKPLRLPGISTGDRHRLILLLASHHGSMRDLHRRGRRLRQVKLRHGIHGRHGVGGRGRHEACLGSDGSSGVSL